jgi:hypothetical protein
MSTKPPDVNLGKSLSIISSAFTESINRNVGIHPVMYMIAIGIVIIMFGIITFGLVSEMYSRVNVSLPRKYIPYFREYFIDNNNDKMGNTQQKSTANE